MLQRASRGSRMPGLKNNRSGVDPPADRLGIGLSCALQYSSDQLTKNLSDLMYAIRVFEEATT